MSGEESALPSVLRVETEREKEVSEQLKRANDAVARLEDELRQAVDTERRLQMLQKMLIKELDELRQRSAPLWEKEMKARDSNISVLCHCL